MTTIRGPVGAVLTAVLALLAAACSSTSRGAIQRHPSGSTPATTEAPVPLQTAVLTSDGADRYGFVPQGRDGVAISARAGNVGSNLRLVFWRVGVAPAVDAEACDTWLPGAFPLAQQGVALRIATAGGVTRAITVSKNVYGMTVFSFNVHTWDSTRGLQQPVGMVDLGAGLHPGGVLLPLPWRMCARAVADRVDVKVWPASVSEPAWGDPTYSGSVALPAGWAVAGFTGWYVAHLPPGSSLSYGDLSARVVTGG